MALEVADLALALRLIADITDTIPAGQVSILTRQLGVGEATIDLLAPDCPSAVREEAILRFSAYAYSVPPGSGRRDAYANILINSGAGSIISRWAPKAASGSTGVLLSPGGNGNGLSPEQIRAIVLQELAGLTLGVNADQLAAAIEAHRALPSDHHVKTEVTEGVGAVSTETRLPVGTVALRLGWTQTQTPSEVIFTRASAHPEDGAAVGTVSGLSIPPFPPALNTDPDLYFFVWIATAAANIADIRLSGGGGTLIGSLSNGAAYTLEGEAGTVYVSNQRLSPGLSAFSISAVVAGELIASQPWVEQQIAAIPAAAGGLTPTKVYTSDGTITTGTRFHSETLDAAAWYQILLKNDRGLTPMVSGKFIDGLTNNDPTYVRGWLRGSATGYLEFEIEKNGGNVEFNFYGPNNTNFQTNLEVWKFA